MNIRVSYWTCILFVLFVNISYIWTYRISPDNVFSHGKISYGTMFVNPKTSSLYVGARGHLFRLWLYNINDTSTSLFVNRVFHLRAEELEECHRMGNSKMECDVWVREIFSKGDGQQQLVLCSSQSMKPTIGTIDSQKLNDIDEFRTMIGICSQQENLNTTAVFVESGNPGNIPSFYSGIRTGLSLENNLIYRPPLMQNDKELYQALRSPIYDSNWLNEPQFVASYDIGSYVFFFFRELVPGIQNQGRNVISRVARICKSDLGGRNFLKQIWTSFLKARLSCSTSSEHPFYFDHIQSVYKIDHDQDVHLYATFTDSFRNSAICAISLNTINQVFDNGLFFEQAANGAVLALTPPERVPSRRPGACYPDSRTLDDDTLNFAKVHFLMSDPISGFYLDLNSQMPTTNKLLSKIVVDKINERTVVIFVLSPFDHTIYKIAYQNPLTSDEHNTQLIAIYSLPLKERVNYMSILPHEYLYVAQDTQVSQFRLTQCFFHATCNHCVVDPYCSWSIARSECFATETVHSTAAGWITNSNKEPFTALAKKCENYLKSITKVLIPGESAHLECPIDPGLSEKDTEWKLDAKHLKLGDTTHIVHSINGGIVLMNITEDHSGTYQCWHHGAPLIEYILRVDTVNCTKPRTVEHYKSAQREWCRKLEDYNSKVEKWNHLYEKVDNKDLESSSHNENI